MIDRNIVTWTRRVGAYRHDASDLPSISTDVALDLNMDRRQVGVCLETTAFVENTNPIARRYHPGEQAPALRLAQAVEAMDRSSETFDPCLDAGA